MPSLSTNQRSVILPFIDKFCNHTCDRQIGLPLRSRPILLSLRPSNCPIIITNMDLHTAYNYLHEIL